ncbi:MAG: MotA/TolQ/ExbB proton channel family protein [Vicinamibacteria bacterium]
MMMHFLLAQSGPSNAFGGGALGFLKHSGPTAIAVILLLMIFSFVSFGIIINKWSTLSRAARESRRFLDVFRRSQKFSEVNAVANQLTYSPLVGMFQAGYQEINQQVRPAPGATGRPAIRSLDAVSRALARAASIEETRLEKRLSFLASTASVSPFIGLFGTVWGIMNAFGEIGRQGSANLAIVAPGISEALITTAAGLFAAIPAALFFNYFSDRVKALSATMDDFAMEFISMVERNFT